MAESTYVLRKMMPDDGEALLRLALASPDTGAIHMAPRYHVDAYQAVVGLDPEALGVVAVLPESGEVVGSSFVSFERMYYEGEVREGAWLHGLHVHPEHRRQGIATQLAAWRVQKARERIGEGGIIGAHIQKGNEASFAVAQSWRRHIAGELATGGVPMRQKPPRLMPSIEVRRAEPGEYAAIASGINSFYADYNFYRRQTVDSLTEWLSKTPFDDPIRHYYVAVNNDKEILAGMGVAEEHRVMEIEVHNLSWPLRLLNLAVKFVPADGRLRQLSAVKAWSAPGHLEVLQHLWETLRWEWRDRGGTMTYSFDARGPLKQVFKTPVWMPDTTLVLVVDAPVAPTESRLNYGG